MKCEDCLNLLESYVDGEAKKGEAERLRTHLATCANCASELEALTGENELYARYDRELQVSPSLWNGIAARIGSEEREVKGKGFHPGEWFAGLFAIPALRFALPAAALAAIAIVAGLAYWRTHPQPRQPSLVAKVDNRPTLPPPVNVESPAPVSVTPQPLLSGNNKRPQPVAVVKTSRPVTNNARAAEQSEFLFTDAAYSDIAERDTASHLEQAQNLLVSFRNIKLGDNDEEVDVSYEKAESRRLLSENIVLRRDAETAGKFPAKSMLGSLEPFLIDIANLPDKAKPADVRQITDRVQRTEIVAELRSY